MMGEDLMSITNKPRALFEKEQFEEKVPPAWHPILDTRISFVRSSSSVRHAQGTPPGF